MGVDYWNKYSITEGRPSVRIESIETYQYGLFVADLAHMPASVCGIWPAFWTVNTVDYPANGEIDIIENINENERSLETLHTAPGCQVVGNELGYQQSGYQESYNCADSATTSNYSSQSVDQGCSAIDTDMMSFGSLFNANSGGVCRSFPSI
jgi:beta-glucanase (GH16 family)